MSSVTPPPVPRANVYFDGFNLYHACFDDRNGGRAHWRQYRWLDLGALCGNLFPDHHINRIRYFTALVNPTPDNPDCRTRQLEYIRALRTIPHLTVHQGRFATTVKKRKRADPEQRPRVVAVEPVEEVHVIEAEEKGSDVNLASYLLVDGFRQEYDVAIVVSNDSDLAEPLRLVRSELGLKVILVNPRRTVAWDLQDAADLYKHIRLWALQASQLPDTLTDTNGVITKPSTW